MFKRCSRCQEEKNISEYRRDKSKPDGFQYHCKQCRRNFDRSNYVQKYGVQAKLRNNDRAAVMRAKLLEYRLEHPCIVCGEDEPACLDFHHEDPEVKEFNIGGRLTTSWTTMAAELAKCVVLCANCHRKFHAGKMALPVT